MEFAIERPARKLLFAAVVFGLAGAYLDLVSVRLVASSLGDVNDEAHLTRAVTLDPANAEYAARLASFELVVRQSPQAALPWLQFATTLNPLKARYWVELALAHQSSGDIDNEKHDLAMALVASPRDPEITWEVANLFLAQGSLDEAMKSFHLVMQNSPPLVPAAIQTCWKVRPEIDFLLERVVPPAADEGFLIFLTSRNETAAAANVWSRMYSLRQPISRPHLFEYVQYLVAHRQPSEAAVVWRQAAEMSELAAYQPSSENLLVNGDFSLDILNGGFDWLHQKIRGVSLALDPNETHSGSRSLRIVFDGAGIDDAGIRQIVPVDPNTEYEFSAFFKAQEMDGAGGARFAIQDLYRETTFLMTDELRDADFWKKTGGRFVTSAETHMLVVRIARVPSGSPIRGKLWIDGLQLVPHERGTTAKLERQ